MKAKMTISTQGNGLHDLLEIIIESMMVAERSELW